MVPVTVFSRCYKTSLFLVAMKIKGFILASQLYKTTEMMYLYY